MSDEVIGKIFFESTVPDLAVRNVQQVGKEKAKMTVILQDADTPNRNGRVYPKAVLEEALKGAFIKEKLATNSLLGEMNHPQPGSTLQRQMTIDLNNVSHLITKVYWDPKDSKTLLGEVETAGTRVGKDFAGLILENNMVCSFSMRGGGDVTKKNGYDYVKSPLKIITWDAVHFPSHKRAYMQKLNEQVSEMDVTKSMVAKYISENSDNYQILRESLECFDNLDLIMSEDASKLHIYDNGGKLLGYSLVEQKLSNEYKNILASLF